MLHCQLPNCVQATPCPKYIHKLSMRNGQADQVQPMPSNSSTPHHGKHAIYHPSPQTNNPAKYGMTHELIPRATNGPAGDSTPPSFLVSSLALFLRTCTRSCTAGDILTPSHHAGQLQSSAFLEDLVFVSGSKRLQQDLLLQTKSSGWERILTCLCPFLRCFDQSHQLHLC